MVVRQSIALASFMACKELWGFAAPKINII